MLYLDLNLDFFGFFILIVNLYVYIYLFFILFILFFCFDSSKFISLNNLNYFSTLNYFIFALLSSFISLAGIPPFLGFLAKFLISIKLLKSSNFFLFFVLIFFNFFVIYFYIQNFKFMTHLNSSNSDHLKLVNGTYYSSSLIFLVLNLMLFFNFFSFFILNDFFFFLMSNLFF